MEILTGILVVVLIIGLVKGAIKTFQRNWIAALLLLIFLFPIWAIWAFFEVFTGDVVKQVAAPTNNVNVSVYNGADRVSSESHQRIPPDMHPIIDARPSNEQTSQSVFTIDADTKECPYCAETIKKNAIVCRFCNRDI